MDETQSTVISAFGNFLLSDSIFLVLSITPVLVSLWTKQINSVFLGIFTFLKSKHDPD